MFEQKIRPENFFLRDISCLRESANAFLRQASAAKPEAFDAYAAIGLLQTVLAAEIVCTLRYTMISISQDGLKTRWIAGEFLLQANDERKHMQMVADRIEQLGGAPDFNPAGFASWNLGFNDCNGDFAKRIAENLEAEASIIAHYRDLIEYFAKRDTQTCLLIKEIVRDEENHTSDMQDILASYLA